MFGGGIRGSFFVVIFGLLSDCSQASSTVRVIVLDLGKRNEENEGGGKEEDGNTNGEYFASRQGCFFPQDPTKICLMAAGILRVDQESSTAMKFPSLVIQPSTQVRRVFSSAWGSNLLHSTRASVDKKNSQCAVLSLRKASNKKAPKGQEHINYNPHRYTQILKQPSPKTDKIIDFQPQYLSQH